MKVCLFLSTQPDDVESSLIRRFTLCDWSHCGFYRIADGWTFSAMHDQKGVAWRPPNPKAKLLLLSAPQMDEAFTWALTKEGAGYDVQQILGFLFNQSVITPGKFICDRLVFAAFEMVGAPLISHRFIPIAHLTPRDILLSPLVTEVKL